MNMNRISILYKLLNSTSNTIKLINEIKPIYNDIKPLIIKGSNLLNKKTQNQKLYIKTPLNTNGGPKFFV